MSDDSRYKLKYKFMIEESLDEGFSESEILKAKEEDDSIGAGDGVFFVNVIKECVFSISAIPYNLSEKDVFKIWILVANALKDKSELFSWQRELAELVDQEMRKIMNAGFYNL